MFSYQHFVLCTVNSCRLLLLEVTLGLLLFPRGRSVVVKPSSHVALRRKIGLNWVIRSANAHFLFFLAEKGTVWVRASNKLIFNYSFHSSQLPGAKSHSFCKRKPVHSFHRHVTTKSEHVIAHVMGSNHLCTQGGYDKLSTEQLAHNTSKSLMTDAPSCSTELPVGVLSSFVSALWSSSAPLAYRAIHGGSSR